MALAGLTMSVPRGEVFGFLGPNGAGKTTAVKLLLGLARASGGEAWVLGSPVGDRRARRGIGYLPELFRYQPWLTAREVLGLHCELASLPRTSWAQEIDDALATVGLADRASSRVATFSKGMQQRLGLGVALLGKPELALLDEPTSALDPVGRHDVREIIRKLKSRGTTVFLNSHLLTEVERVCDRVAIIDRGRVIATGALADLLERERVVRVRVEETNGAVRGAVSAFGAVREDGGWLIVNGCSRDRVPDLVAQVVRAGGRIYAVDTGGETLEELFIGLIARQDGAS